MQAVLPKSLKEQFALTASMREEEFSYRERMARFAARERQMTAEQELAAKRAETETQALLDQMLAPPARIAEFEAKLDTYDSKTVEALMENEEALDLVRERMNDMLGNAHVLPDGRKVFKTADGQNVYDEHGQKLDRDLVDPAGIDDRKPTWETFKGIKDERHRLNAERQELLDYQAKLDDARGRLDGGKITTKQLDDMERDLRVSMPDAVRRKVELEDGWQKAPSPTAAPASLPDGMDGLMQQTGLGRSLPTGPRL